VSASLAVRDGREPVLAARAEAAPTPVAAPTATAAAESVPSA